MGNESRNKARGQSVVEMALLLPVLLLILFGLIEFGRALFIYTVVSNAAREGARQGLVEPTNQDLIKKAAYSRLILIPTSTLGITITYDTGDLSMPIPATDVIKGESRVVVRTGYRFRMITPIISSIFPPTTIRFFSARTISPGARAHKPPAP
jgi:Flp pilus assembly protein TadG